MKSKATLFYISIVIFVLAASCQPEAPAVVNQVFVEKFQNGRYPDASYAGCADATLISDDPTSNYGTATTMQMGVAASSAVYHSVIRFDIAGILPDGITIEKAIVTLYCTDKSEQVAFDVYELESAWNESAVCWDYRDGAAAPVSWTTPGGDFGSGPVSTLAIGPPDLETSIDFELPGTIVKSWIDSPQSNLGIIIVPQSSAADLYAIAVSGDNNVAIEQDMRPMLTIFYSVDLD